MEQDEVFMEQALGEARQALALGEFPVGCVLVAEGKILAQGHRRNSQGDQANELDHAEMLTLRSLGGKGSSSAFRHITVYSTLEPCLMCFASLLLSGVRRFVWAYEDVMGGGTSLPLEQLNPLYQNMQVDLLPGVFRQESLALFALFFQQHSYWQESLLSRYTLAEYAKQP
jgi:tRNA(adenine34) deaminase